MPQDAPSAVCRSHRRIESVWRVESARIIAAIARLTRDLDLAEECAQEALLSALQHWPDEGIPQQPRAWLIAVAKRRAIDQLRRHQMLQHKHEALPSESEEDPMRPSDPEQAAQDPFGDDLLRLLFVACHPSLAVEAQMALTLRLLGGLGTDEIARAFLQSEATIAQRIVRAKRTLANTAEGFEVPALADIEQRLDAVLGVIYLMFNEGYTASAGDHWMRPALCEEAMRLARILAALLPRHAEVQALLALMELQASRIPARTDPEGHPILLAEQNRARWDRLLIRRGLEALKRALALGGADGSYALQAAIAACHARAPSTAQTDWHRIAELYQRLGEVAPSPIVDLNHAVAIGMAHGFEAGLSRVDALMDEPRLQHYHLLYAVRAEFLEKLGRGSEASTHWRQAAALTRNQREQNLLLERAESSARR